MAIMLKAAYKIISNPVFLMTLKSLIELIALWMLLYEESQRWHPPGRT